LVLALPPLRPAATFWVCVPPCEELLRDDDPADLPPRLDAPGEFAHPCPALLRYSQLVNVNRTTTRSHSRATVAASRVAS
jgi:hypothetical protein